MRTLLIIIIIGIMCSSCGKKGSPVYKSTNVGNLTVYSI